MGNIPNPLARLAASTPFLDAEEEKNLARRAGDGDDEAVNRLVASHLRVVIAMARKYRGWGLPMNDLIQEGTLGLLQAVRRFDPGRGVRLSTYAGWWVRATLQDYVLRSWSQVRAGTTNAQKALVLSLRRLVPERGDSDTGDIGEDLATRLARRFETTATEVRALAMRIAGRDLSLDQYQNRPGLIERLASDRPTPEQSASQISERTLLANLIAAALSHLPAREQQIIKRRYFEDARHTFESIGRELGISKARVRQLEARALAKLAAFLAPQLEKQRP